MTGCSAPFCNNSSAKGYIMKVFPRDPQRRAQWAKNTGRKDWTPTDRSYLCEVHFTEDMWERRVDNKPKLKPNAVPTIFSFFIKDKTSRVTQNKQSFKGTAQTLENLNELSTLLLQKSAQTPETLNESSILNDNRLMQNENQTNTEVNLMIARFSDLNTLSISNLNISEIMVLLDKFKNQCEEQRKVIETQDKSFKKIRNMLQEKNDKLRQIEKKLLNGNKYKRALERIFNEDQIRALFTKRQSARNWCNDTIARALQLKFACGTTGYKELLRQNIPLPSLRTLRRKLENLKFTSAISDEVFDFLKLKAPHFNNECDQECGFESDEMSTTPQSVYDLSTKLNLGDKVEMH